MMFQKFLTLFFAAAIFLFFITACTNNANTNLVEEGDVVEDTDTDDVVVINETTASDSIRVVFYKLVSPVELTDFVRFSNTSFDGDLLNPSENKGHYNINLKQALNLGVYGTDLIYCRIFNQKQVAITYLATIRNITKDIGIPEEEVSETLGRADENMDDRDSIFSIIQEAYLNADSYLNDNDRKSTAALIYFGSWAESLFLAINMNNKDGANKQAIQTHIAAQKFTLNHLLTLLRNSYGNEDLHHYMILINHLKRIYDDIDVVASQKSVVDTLGNTIVIDEDKIKITNEQMKEITKVVNRLRTDIVS